jgi:hypothetical protein
VKPEQQWDCREGSKSVLLDRRHGRIRKQVNEGNTNDTHHDQKAGCAERGYG